MMKFVIYAHVNIVAIKYNYSKFSLNQNTEDDVTGPDENLLNMLNNIKLISFFSSARGIQLIHMAIQHEARK